MLTGDEDMEISALAKREWTVSAIARHLGRDREDGPSLSGGN